MIFLLDDKKISVVIEQTERQEGCLYLGHTFEYMARRINAPLTFGVTVEDVVATENNFVKFCCVFTEFSEKKHSFLCLFQQNNIKSCKLKIIIINCFDLYFKKDDIFVNTANKNSITDNRYLDLN